MALDDYAGLIRSGQASVPDPTAAAVQQQLASAQVTGANLQNQQSQMQMAMAQRALIRQQQFSQQMQGFVRNPTAQGLASLTGNFPEFAAQAKDAWGPLNEEQRRREATQMGEIATLAAGGNANQAAQLFQDRVDADQKAGVERNPQQDQQILGMLKSGDPQQIRAVVAMTAAASGAAVGWDKAGEWLESLGLSKKLSEQPKLEHVETTNSDGSTTSHAFSPYSGGFGAAAAPGAPIAGGGGQTSGAGPTTPPPAGGGLQGSVAHVLGNEGGLNKSDMNGSPTNFGINYAANKPELAKLGIASPGQMGNLTKDQAAQIYAEKYWPQSGAEKLSPNLQAPYFDVYVRSPKIAKSALAQSGGDPAKFAQITNTYFQNMAANNPKAAVYAHAWAARDAGNAAIATGQAANAVSTVGGSQAQSNPYEVGGSSGALNTKGAEPGHAWNPPHTGEVTVPGSDADPNSYAAEVEPAARIWLYTGQFPTGGGGMGGGGQMTLGEKNAIYKKAMEIWTGAGHSPADLQTFRSNYAGLSTQIQNAQGMVANMSAAKEALEQHANMVLSSHKALVGMGIVHDDPSLGGLVSANWKNNTYLDWYETHGTPEQQAAVKTYKDSVNAYAKTYSKFMTAANATGGSASPTDATNKQADELNDFGMGPTALRRHLQTVLAETNQKKSGWEKQLASLQQQMSKLGNLDQGPSPAPQGVTQIDPHAAPAMQLKQYAGLPHGAHYIDPSGVHRTKP